MYFRLREIREEMGYSQQYVADCLKCEKLLYEKYESGKRKVPLEVVCKLADLYNTSTDYLFGLTDQKARHEA